MDERTKGINGRARAERFGPFFGVPSMVDSFGGESPLSKPDGDEGLVKRKGIAARRGAERSVEQTREPMDKNCI
jgi:hypothetical protein